MTNLEEIKDAAGLWAAIEKMADVKLGDVPILTKFLWFPTPQTAGKTPTIFEMGPDDIPLKPGYLHFAMFQDSEEVRIYGIAREIKDEEGRPNPPLRLTLSKHAPLCGVEIMALPIFVNEVADELIMLDEDEEEEEEDDDKRDAKKEAPANGQSAVP